MSRHFEQPYVGAIGIGMTAWRMSRTRCYCEVHGRQSPASLQVIVYSGGKSAPLSGIDW